MPNEIAKRLRKWCTDWNGATMVRGEPPRDGLHCDLLLDAAAELDRLSASVTAQQILDWCKRKLDGEQDYSRSMNVSCAKRIIEQAIKEITR